MTILVWSFIILAILSLGWYIYKVCTTDTVTTDGGGPEDS